MKRTKPIYQFDFHDSKPLIDPRSKASWVKMSENPNGLKFLKEASLLSRISVNCFSKSSSSV